MAQYITFFNRQTVMGNPGSVSGEIYSDVFDASNASNVNPSFTELEIYVASGTGTACKATIQENDDPSFAEAWTDYGSIEQSGTGWGTGSWGTGLVPKRFLRAKLDVQPDSFMIVKFSARLDS